MLTIAASVFAFLLGSVAVYAGKESDQRITQASTRESATVNNPCGMGSTEEFPPARGRIEHVIWIWFENHGTSEVMGPDGMEYLASLPELCGSAEANMALGAPSLTNYLGATTGQRTVDETCTPAKCPQSLPTLMERLEQAGKSWRVYAESMPAKCYPKDRDKYAVRHNAPAYFPALAESCKRNDVYMGMRTEGPLAQDLASGELPNFAWMVPDLCNSAHDCSLSVADSWLRPWVRSIVQTEDYQAGRTAVFITFDEGYETKEGQVCRRPTGNCLIPLVVLSAATPKGARISTPTSTYSLLRTTQELFGAEPLLGNASSAPGLASLL